MASNRTFQMTIEIEWNDESTTVEMDCYNSGYEYEIDGPNANTPDDIAEAYWADKWVQRDMDEATREALDTMAREDRYGY